MQVALQQGYHGKIVRAFEKSRDGLKRMHRIRVTLLDPSLAVLYARATTSAGLATAVQLIFNEGE